MWLALAACTPAVLPPTSPTAGTTSVPTSSPTDTDTTASTVDSVPAAPTGDTAPEIDCSVLPELPVEFDTYSGWGTAEDFDLDGDGYHVSVPSRDLRGRLGDGSIKIISASVANFGTAGTRVLPDGNWVVADVGQNSIVHVTTATGGQQTIATGLDYPNGVEPDTQGYIFVGEQNANRVRQIEVATGDDWIIGTGLTAANGVTLSPDEQILYVGSFGSGKVWKIPRLGPTDWAAPEVLIDQPGFSGGFDGINADACGNVYITEYVKGIVWRITPDGTQVNEVAELPSSWIPNMRWGHGIGGWETDILYVADRNQGRIFALHMGIEGKRHVLAP